MVAVLCTLVDHKPTLPRSQGQAMVEGYCGRLHGVLCCRSCLEFCSWLHLTGQSMCLYSMLYHVLLWHPLYFLETVGAPCQLTNMEIVQLNLLMLHKLSFSVQGMARMCCDTRKSVRQTAITYLQRALLAHELQNLTSLEWESCFLQV